MSDIESDVRDGHRLGPERIETIS